MLLSIKPKVKNMNQDQIRIVVLKCPYFQFENSQASEIFIRTLNLKKIGYEKEYPMGVLPIDTTDFISTHVLACGEGKGGFMPLMGFRSVSLESLDFFKLPFPLFGVLRSSDAYEHLEVVESIVQSARESKKNLCYDSSWTIAPLVREKHEFKKELRKIMEAIHVLYHLENQTAKLLAGGMKKFKMEKIYEYWGYKKISKDGVVLPEFELSFLFNEEAEIFYLKQFNEFAIAQAKTMENLWIDRVELLPDAQIAVRAA